MDDLAKIFEGQEELEKKTLNPVLLENFYKKLGLNHQEPITYSMFSKILKSIEFN